MRTWQEILDVAKPELARWLATNPRVFANRVITITDVMESGTVRVFSGTLEQVPASMASLGNRLRARMTPDASPVIIVRANGDVGLETFFWTRALAATPGDA